MSLSTLRAPISRENLTSLTDDSLLVILRYLSVPQLLTFLSLSRRLNSLIVQYTLPHYRTIHLPNLPNLTIAIAKFELLRSSIFFSRPYYSHRNFYVRAAMGINRGWPDSPSHFLSVPLFKSQLSSFPLDLPRLLWRLQSLTFPYFLDDKCLLNDEEKLINQCLTVYLRSSWSETLVSLKLCLVDISTDSSPFEKDTCHFAQLNNLSSLKHLFLHFVFNGTLYTERAHLPDSLPVLAQLHSFSLHWYNGPNTVPLLHQIGPNLALLSLYDTDCQFEEVLRFLCSKPSYKQTFTSLEFNSCRICSSQLSTMTSSLPALVHLSGPFSFNCASWQGDSLFTYFTILGRLSQLREMFMFYVSLEDLRALRDAYPPHRWPILPSIRRLALNIECFREEELHQRNEIFNGDLPLLGAIFCAVEDIKIEIGPSLCTDSVPLSRQLADKVKEHFPSVRTCKARYNTIRLIRTD